VSLTTDDHPYTDLPLVFPNFATHDRSNYLYHAERSIFFFTVFIVKDSAKRAIKPLGFICWKSRMVAKIQWRHQGGSEVPDPAEVSHNYLTAEDYLPGAPNNSALKIIANPPTDPGKTIGAVDKANFNAALRSTANNAGVQASNTWSDLVPKTHFAP
jgi:hypothetical protein